MPHGGYKTDKYSDYAAVGEIEVETEKMRVDGRQTTDDGTMIAIDRTLRIAVLVSIGIHIIGMSVVSIITPEDLFPTKPYTRVDFLGSILDKTMFDIMMEDAGAPGPGVYGENGIGRENEYLEVSAKRREPVYADISAEMERGIESRIIEVFRGTKLVPDVTLEFEPGGFSSTGWMSELEEPAGRRKVAYKPDAPVIMPGLFGYSDEFVVRVRALVSPQGTVLKAEPVTTSGYAEIDLTAVEYVRGWVFAPDRSRRAGDEWLELDIRLRPEE